MKWPRFIRTRRRNGELADEIESYLAIATDENIAAGMSPQEAALAARRKFGNATLVKEKVRDMNSLTWFEDFWNDLRHGTRILKFNPGFFAVATLSLALGIGANTAIFQLLNSVRLRMLPVPQPEQLVELEIFDDGHCCSGDFSTRRPNFTFAQWEQIRDHQQVFSSIFAFADARFNLSERGEAHYAEGLWVSGSFFQTLGVSPALGRMLTPEDDRPGCGSPGAVISYPYWQRQFAGSPDAIGKKLSLDGHPVEIVGVAARGFFGTEVGRSFEIAVPVCAEEMIQGESKRVPLRHAWWLAVIGRLKSGSTIAQASAQAGVLSKQVFETTVPPNFLPQAAKEYSQFKLIAKPAGSGVSGLRNDYERPLWLLLAIAGAVLLIACANLANLMLARASVREREMAVRLAIGAARGRLVRQMLAESALLTLAGIAGGILVARVLSRYLLDFLTTPNSPLFLDLSLDWRMLAFTSAVGIVTCLLFGVAPAMRAASASPGAAMKAGGRAITSDRSRLGLRRVLVIVQIALSLVLLTGALLFSRSLRNLTTIDAGLNEDDLVIANVSTAKSKYPQARRNAVYENLVTRLRAIPGVEQASSAAIVQLSGSGWNPPIELVGVPPPKKFPNVWFNRISSGYFQTMGTPMLAGRDFRDRDNAAAPEVAIVTQMFRDQFFNGADPIGKQFRILAGPGEDPHLYEIVGVVKDSKYRGLANPIEPLVFVAQSQDKHPGRGIRLLVRSKQALGPLTAAIQGALLEENSEIAVQFEVFKQMVHNSLLRERLMATLSGFFGFLAALLATIGLYGVISYMVARRKNEIGIRVALGANRFDIVRLIIREAAILLFAGLVIGAGIASSGARVAKSLLYGLEAHDPITLGMAVGLLAIVSLCASLLPALRASRLDPIDALREE